jgi:hypothetical protein
VSGGPVGADLDGEVVAAGEAYLRPAFIGRLEQQRGGLAFARLVLTFSRWPAPSCVNRLDGEASASRFSASAVA